MGRGKHAGSGRHPGVILSGAQRSEGSPNGVDGVPVTDPVTGATLPSERFLGFAALRSE